MCLQDSIELIISDEQCSAGQKATNQNGHCHGYTRFFQPENEVLILAVDFPLFDVMFNG